MTLIHLSKNEQYRQVPVQDFVVKEGQVPVPDDIFIKFVPSAIFKISKSCQVLVGRARNTNTEMNEQTN